MHTSFDGIDKVRGDNLRIMQILINIVRGLIELGMRQFKLTGSIDTDMNLINFEFFNEHLILQDQKLNNLKKFFEFEIKPDIQLQTIEFFASDDFKESIQYMTFSIFVAK